MKFHPVVSEEKIVEIVDGRRTTDIQGITKAHPELCSGELIKLVESYLQTICAKYHSNLACGLGEEYLPRVHISFKSDQCFWRKRILKIFLLVAMATRVLNKIP